MARITLALSLCLAAPSFAVQTVHVVQGGGGALQAAIDAAADGDTLLVRAGMYTGCSITAKGLSVVSDAPGATLVDTVRVTGTAATQPVVVSGFHVRTPALVAGPPQTPSCVVLTNCAGSVRLVELTNQILTPHSSTAVHVEACDDVALARCAMTGSSGTSVTGSLSLTAIRPGPGLTVIGSQVAAHDCVLRGGDGNDGFYFTQQIPFFPFPPTPGAPGADVRAGSVLALNAGQCAGGQGGNGLPGHCSPSFGTPVAGGPAADGGPGLATEALAQSYTLGTALQGGAGGVGIGGANCSGMLASAGAPGNPGAATSGPLTTFTGTPGTFAGPTRARSGQPMPFTVTGAPGDAVYLAFSFDSQWQLIPALEGVYLFGAPARRALLGVIPGSGSLAVSLPAEVLPAGVLALERHIQVITRDQAGALQLGSFGVVTILDPSL